MIKGKEHLTPEYYMMHLPFDKADFKFWMVDRNKRMVKRLLRFSRNRKEKDRIKF